MICEGCILEYKESCTLAFVGAIGAEYAEERLSGKINWCNYYEARPTNVKIKKYGKYYSAC